MHWQTDFQLGGADAWNSLVTLQSLWRHRLAANIWLCVASTDVLAWRESEKMRRGSALS